MHKTDNKSAEETKNALIKTAESIPKEIFLTITFDNGTEGAKHTEIRREYEIDTYFCDPFSSWQKGRMENINKLDIICLETQTCPNLQTEMFMRFRRNLTTDRESVWGTYLQMRLFTKWCIENLTI